MQQGWGGAPAPGPAAYPAGPQVTQQNGTASPPSAPVDPAQFIRSHPDGSIEIKLQKPIMVHGQAGPTQSSVLRLRPATFGDWDELGGDPFEATSLTPATTYADFKPKPAAVAAWLSRLSGHDPGVIKQLGMLDFRLAFFALVRLTLGSAT